MKIGFLTSEFPDITGSAFGGIATSIKNLAHAFIAEGQQVTIFLYGQAKDEIIMLDQLKIVCIKNIQVKGISWILTRIKIARIINQEFQRRQLDILEVPDWTGISAWMKIDCPVVMRLNGSDTYFCHLEKRPIKWWNKLLEKSAFKQADKIIAVSKFVGDVSNQIFNANRTFEVIPNSIRSELFQPQNIQPSNLKTILYFGTLIRKKGVLELPDIINRVYQEFPDVAFVLIGADARDVQTGNSSTWDIMHSLLNEAVKSKVKYLGKMPYESVKDWIDQSTICVFPSYAEACPLSWIEAMAMKKSLVTSNIGWSKEMIEDEVNGYMVDPKNHALYANRIISLLKDESLRNKMAERAQQTVFEKFDTSITVRQNLKSYQSLLNHE